MLAEQVVVTQKDTIVMEDLSESEEEAGDAAPAAKIGDSIDSDVIHHRSLGFL